MIFQVALIIAGVVFLMLLRVPIGFAFGLGAIVMMLLFGIDPQWALSSSFDLQLSFAFLALPLYLLLGSVLGVAGMAERISDFIVTVIGRLKGGLGVALVATCGFFGAISGVAMSALVGIGRAFLPIMEKEGYPKDYTIALLISSAGLAILIPPSGNMILFGFMGFLPISLCFLAPLIPGMILMFFLSVVHLVMCRNIPTIHVPPPTNYKTFTGNVMKSGYKNFLTLILPIIVLGGIYGGIYTPAEAASVGTFYTLIIGFLIYRSITLRAFGGSLLRTGMDIGSIIALVFFFLIISKIFILTQISDQILAVMMAVSTNRWVLMGMINVLMIIMGMIMADGPGTIISAVILLPIAKSLGFDPYHFAAMTCVNLGLGMLTPPVASLLYVGGHISDLPLKAYVRKVMYYLLFAHFPTLILTVTIPPLSTFLPHLFMKKLVF